MNNQVSVAILVGGRSSRMGRPKERIILKGNTDFMTGICQEFDDSFNRYLSVNPGQNYAVNGYQNVTDKYGNIGPMGAILSVLEMSGTPAVLVLACDMPFFGCSDALKLINEYRGEDVLLAETKSGIQPLAAIYSQAAAVWLKKYMDEGNYRLREAIFHMNYRKIYFEDEKPFININTEDELNKYIRGI